MCGASGNGYVSAPDAAGGSEGITYVFSGVDGVKTSVEHEPRRCKKKKADDTQVFFFVRRGTFHPADNHLGPRKNLRCVSALLL